MATRTMKANIQTARSHVEEGRRKISEIRRDADLVKPELQASVAEVDDILNSTLSLVDSIAQDAGWWATARRFDLL